MSMSTFVAGEDNSWKCEHNLKILLSSIDDFAYLEGVGQKIKEYQS